MGYPNFLLLCSPFGCAPATAREGCPERAGNPMIVCYTCKLVPRMRSVHQILKVAGMACARHVRSRNLLKNIGLFCNTNVSLCAALFVHAWWKLRQATRRLSRDPMRRPRGSATQDCLSVVCVVVGRGLVQSLTLLPCQMLTFMLCRPPTLLQPWFLHNKAMQGQNPVATSTQNSSTPN